MSPPLTMHSFKSQESITSDISTTTSRPTKHVRFAPMFEQTRRHSSDSLESISESQEDWEPDTTATASMPQADSKNPCKNGHEFVRDHSQSSRQTCSCGKVRHSDLRHAATRIPSGSTRRASVQAFDDVKRRWSAELTSGQSAIDDEDWGFESTATEPTLPKFNVHHW